ncbi:MAG TPA: hypothetical protein VM571_06135 [Noviherbaspirillum sp.]|nr:hypothetical protein [Noviherbaspirillum sp.]
MPTAPKPYTVISISAFSLFSKIAVLQCYFHSATRLLLPCLNVTCLWYVSLVLAVITSPVLILIKQHHCRFALNWGEILKALLFILMIGIGAVVLQGFDAMLATAAQPPAGLALLRLQAIPPQPVMSAEALVHLSRTDPDAYYQYLNRPQ